MRSSCILQLKIEVGRVSRLGCVQLHLDLLELAREYIITRVNLHNN